MVRQAAIGGDGRLLARCESAGLGRQAEQVLAGERLSREDGLTLYATPHLHVLGELANHVRERLAYFNVNQPVNYTNLCNKLCRFCAFQRLPGQEGWMAPEKAAAKVSAQLDQPVTEVHMVAGVWPKSPYQYYLDLLRAVKAARPGAMLVANGCPVQSLLMTWTNHSTAAPTSPVVPPENPARTGESL